MRRKKLEHALRRAVEDLPRPGLDAVSSPPIVRMEVHDYITRPDAPDPRLRRRRLASLAAAACLLAVIAGAAVWMQFFQIYSTVELTVNPHFSIHLSRRDQVRGVDGVNDDAQALLEGRSYRGWTLEATVNSLMDELALKGYLLTSAGQVDVLAASKSLPHAQELQEEVEALVAAKLSGLDPPEPEPEPDPSPEPVPSTSATPSPVPSPSAGYLPPPSVPVSPTVPSVSPAVPPSPSPAVSPTPVHTPMPTPMLTQPQPLTEADVESMVRDLFPGGKIQEIKLDEDDGVSYYEVELKDGEEKIDLEIDAYTGEVLVLDYDD